MALSALLNEHDLPPRLPSSSSDDDAIRSSILKAYRPVAFGFSGGSDEAVWSFELPLGNQSSEANLEFQCHGNRYSLHFVSLPDFARWKPELAGVDLKLLPEELAIAVLEVIFEQPLKQLEKQGLGIKIQRFTTNPESSVDGDLGWKVEFPHSGNTWNGFFRTSQAGAKLLMDVVNSVPVAISDLQEQHPLPIGLKVAEQELSPEQWAGLREHDVILVNATEHQSQKGTLLISGSARAKCHQEANQWLLGEASPPSASLNPEKVTIHFATELQVQPIGEIQKWTQDTLLPFSSDPLQEVSLFVNQCQVGRGVWLQLGDKPAVRITELSKA